MFFKAHKTKFFSAIYLFYIMFSWYHLFLHDKKFCIPCLHIHTQCCDWFKKRSVICINPTKPRKKKIPMMIMFVEFWLFFVLLFIIVTLFFSRRNQHHKYERKRCNKIILLNVIWPIIFYVLRGKHISEVERKP